MPVSVAGDRPCKLPSRVAEKAVLAGMEAGRQGLGKKMGVVAVAGERREQGLHVHGSGRAQ